MRVGGIRCSKIERIAITDSIDPAAPMQWPIAPLSEVTGIDDARAPKTFLIAIASAGSPDGVEAACA